MINLEDGRTRTVVSGIIGLGLALLFRSACKGAQCVVVKAPPVAELSKYHYKIDSDCYKYTPYVVPCK
jgi:hypothetical protein